MIAYQLLIGSIVAATVCSAQVAFSRVIPYDPRYMMRRVPVRRSVDVDPRVRLPIARYFPQVEPQVAELPYVAREPVVSAAYQLPNGEIYALPSQWTEDAYPMSSVDGNEENDYDSYDYENEFGPVYGKPYQNEVYAAPQEPEIQENDADLYNDLMVNYFLSEMKPSLEETKVAEIQRRSQEPPLRDIYTEQYREENKKQNESNIAQPTPSTSAAPAVPESSPAAPVSSYAAGAPPPTTAIPKSLRESMKIAQYPINQMGHIQKDMWREFHPAERGQKEYLMYRQMPVGTKKSAMTSLEEQLSRAKSSGANSKDAFSVVEKLMSTQQGKDPLAEQLDSLKFRNM